MPDRAAASGLRARIARVVERATRFRFAGTAVLKDAAVLDGRTLTGLAVIGGLREHDRANVLLVARRSDGKQRTTAIGPPNQRQGQLTIPFAVPLEDAGGLDLRRGEWRLALAYRTAGGAQRPIPTMGTILARGRRSPAVWNPRSPRTGRRYRPSVDDDGNLLLTVVRFPTHAEVERVRLSGTQLSIEGRIVGSPKLARRAERADVAVAVVRVDGTQRRRFPARVSDGTFSASIPLGRLRFTQDAEWVVRLRIGKAKPLVVRRVLTDLREPAAVYRYPVARLRGRRRVTTTYDDKTALLLQCRRLSPPGGPPA